MFVRRIIRNECIIIVIIRDVKQAEKIKRIIKNIYEHILEVNTHRYGEILFRSGCNKSLIESDRRGLTLYGACKVSYYAKFIRYTEIVLPIRTKWEPLISSPAR